MQASVSTRWRRSVWKNNDNWNLQRHDIHPSLHVQATLQALKEQQTPSSLPISKSPGLLPPAVPEMIRQAQQSFICA